MKGLWLILLALAVGHGHTRADAPRVAVEWSDSTATATDFGTLNLNAASPAKTFVIKNLGDAALTLKSIAIVNDRTVDFVLNRRRQARRRGQQLHLLGAAGGSLDGLDVANAALHQHHQRDLAWPAADPLQGGRRHHALQQQRRRARGHAGGHLLQRHRTERDDHL